MTKNQNSQILNFPNTKFRVLYIDPPWAFSSWSKKGEGKSAQNHYKCMTMDELKALPIGDLGDDNSIMFMWCTNPLFPEQIKVMEKWGYTYKTIGFTWVKLNKKTPTPFIGLGYYSRSNCEYLIIGTKGKVGRPKNKSISSVVMSPIREHSRKPDIIRKYIEAMYDGPYIELFARTKIDGWECWGNQTDLFQQSKTLFD
jgi:N6-adenosine-specific RNA methylase IME4